MWSAYDCPWNKAHQHIAWAKANLPIFHSSKARRVSQPPPPKNKRERDLCCAYEQTIFWFFAIIPCCCRVSCRSFIANTQTLRRLLIFSSFFSRKNCFLIMAPSWVECESFHWFSLTPKKRQKQQKKRFFLLAPRRWLELTFRCCCENNFGPHYHEYKRHLKMLRTPSVEWYQFRFSDRLQYRRRSCRMFFRRDRFKVRASECMLQSD